MKIRYLGVYLATADRTPGTPTADRPHPCLLPGTFRLMVLGR